MLPPPSSQVKEIGSVQNIVADVRGVERSEEM